MDEVKLPEGWEYSQLLKLGTIVTGKTPSTKDVDNFGGNIPFIKPGDLDKGGFITETSDTLTESGLLTVPKLPVNAIVVTCIGNLGKVGITTKTSATNQQINSFVCNENLNFKFLYYQICTLKPWLENESSATTIAIVNKGKFSKAPISIPSLAEQKIIADKLDTLLAQVDSAKARLEQIPQILKRFRQAVLAAAVSGKLTEEWRQTQKISESAELLLKRWLIKRESDFKSKQEIFSIGKKKGVGKKFKAPVAPDCDTGRTLQIPSSWKLISVSQFADCLDNQRIPVKKEDRKVNIGKYPYFGANGEVDKIDDFIFDGDFVLVTEDETFYGREKPIAYRYTGKCWVNNHAHVLSAQTKIANDYLCYSLMHYHIIPWLSGTTGRAKLTQGALSVLPIGLPPEIEMTEIVHRVEQLFSYADTIEKQVQNALERVNNLTHSILAKAFRGELTAQWRAENPELISGENSAQALLAKIQQQRSNTKTIKRSKGDS